MKYMPSFSFLPRLGGRRAAFKLGVIVTLAIAVGANIAVLGNLGVLFGNAVPGAANQSLLEPYFQPLGMKALLPSMWGIQRSMYDRLAASLGGRADTALYWQRGATLSDKSGGNSAHFAYLKVTPSMARVLGVQVVAGRGLSATDMQRGATPRNPVKRSIPARGLDRCPYWIPACAGMTEGSSCRRQSRSADRKDFGADVQFRPDAVGRVHGLTAGQAQREAGAIAQAQAEAAGVGFEVRGGQRIVGQKWHDFEVQSLDIACKFVWCQAVAGNPRGHFRKIDGRYAGAVNDCRNDFATGFFEQVRQEGRCIQNAHSRSASRRRSAMNSSTTFLGLWSP